MTDPGVWGGIICPPWPWPCYPGFIPGDIVVGKVSSTDFGWNAGVGLTFNLNSGSQLYLEARYNQIDTDVKAEFIPIVFGYRW